MRTLLVVVGAVVLAAPLLAQGIVSGQGGGGEDKGVSGRSTPWDRKSADPPRQQARRRGLPTARSISATRSGLVAVPATWHRGCRKASRFRCFRGRKR